MSNNKQSMKLYTEEQVKHMLIGLIGAAKTVDDFLHRYYTPIELPTPIKLPSDEEIWRWWQTQKFQKEQGEQEYTMLYEIDLAKILKSFTEHLIQVCNK